MRGLHWKKLPFPWEEVAQCQGHHVVSQVWAGFQPLHESLYWVPPALHNPHTIHGLLITVWLTQSKGRISLPAENENKALMAPSWEEDDQESGMGEQQRLTLTAHPARDSA